MTASTSGARRRLGAAAVDVPRAPGSVVALFTAPAAGEPMVPCAQVQIVRGKGVRGDRYFDDAGTFSRGREVTDITLVELEAINFLRSRGIQLDAASTRRNIVTRAVALNDLVGERFRVGEVYLLAVSLCEPCASLFAPEHRRAALRGLAHHGGLRARILSDGVIRTGDPVLARSHTSSTTCGSPVPS